MKDFVLLLALLFIIQCECQYPVTIDGQVSDWQPESAFSVGSNITCYLGWWNGDINFALKTTNSTINKLKVFFYFNKQPFQTFSTGSDTGNSFGITTQFGTTTFPFHADAVAVWSYSDGLKLYEWNNTSWNSIANSTQTAISSIVEGKIISANNSLCTNSFTSVWIQFANLLTNTTIGTLPGDYLAFTFPLINTAVASTWKGYVTGFPATFVVAGLWNESNWLGNISLDAANSTNCLNTNSAYFTGSDIGRAVNVAVSGGSNLNTYDNSILKFGHDSVSSALFSVYPIEYQTADIVFDASPLEVSTQMYIGAPATVTWRNYPIWSSPNVRTLSLGSYASGPVITMEFYDNSSLPITTLNMYAGVKLNLKVENNTGGLRYKTVSTLVYKNSTFTSMAYKSDEWDSAPNRTSPDPNSVIIEQGVTFHTQLDINGYLSATAIQVYGTLMIDGTSLDNRLEAVNMTIYPTGSVIVWSQDLLVSDQFQGANFTNVQCQPGFSVLVNQSQVPWPGFDFSASNGTHTMSFSSSTTNIIRAYNNFIQLWSGEDMTITDSTGFIVGQGFNVTVFPALDTKYFVGVTHSTGCWMQTSVSVTLFPSPSSTPSRTPSPSRSSSPSRTPSPSASSSPSPTPSSSPSYGYSISPSPTPSSSPSYGYSVSPSASPSLTPSPSPSNNVSVNSSATPSVSSLPSVEPTSPSSSGNDSATSPLLGLIALIALLPAAAIAFLIIKKRSRNHENNMEEMSEKLPTDTPPGPLPISEDRYTTFEKASSTPEISLSQATPVTTSVTEPAAVPETRTEPKQSVLRSPSLTMNWEIDFNEIKILEELGRGAFGVVYKCKWRNTECVVKQIDKENAIDLTSILKEANNVRNIRSHPNVCQVFGVCTNPEYPICIVMEYLADGSLDNLLYEERITITPQRLLEFAKSIASGMSHVHKENILHCDLACRNILVEQKRIDKYVLKIADFGLSRVVETNEYKASSSTAFPIRWTAPEALRSGKISRASDIWSYGVTLWEIAEAKRPYPALSNTEVLEGVCDKGLRLPRPKRVQIPDELWVLMQRCWLAPSERPSFDTICEELDEIEEKYFGSNAVPLDNSRKEHPVIDGPTSYATMAEYRTNNNTANKPE